MCVSGSSHQTCEDKKKTPPGGRNWARYALNMLNHLFILLLSMTFQFCHVLSKLCVVPIMLLAF